MFNICHNILWKMGVQYCKTHIFPFTILVIIILGKHFPQTRRSLDRDQVKACLLNKIKFCSRENQLKTYNKNRMRNIHAQKVRCMQLVVADLVHLKRTAFKSKHKIQDCWEDAIYYVEGQPYAGLPVFRIAQVAGEGKMKSVHQTCYSCLEATLKGGLRMREVDKMLTEFRIASWQSLVMGFQRLKLCQLILNPRMRVMQSV